MVKGQSAHVEVDVTGGYSTDDVSAIATQVRMFGEMRSGLRIYLEGAWAARTIDGESESDAFGAAYPYGNRVQAIEAYGERLFVRAKRFWDFGRGDIGPRSG